MTPKISLQHSINLSLLYLFCAEINADASFSSHCRRLKATWRPSPSTEPSSSSTPALVSCSWRSSTPLCGLDRSVSVRWVHFVQAWVFSAKLVSAETDWVSSGKYSAISLIEFPLENTLQFHYLNLGRLRGVVADGLNPHENVNRPS